MLLRLLVRINPAAPSQWRRLEPTSAVRSHILAYDDNGTENAIACQGRGFPFKLHLVEPHLLEEAKLFMWRPRHFLLRCSCKQGLWGLWVLLLSSAVGKGQPC